MAAEIIKPKVKIVGNRSTFNVFGICEMILKSDRQFGKAAEMKNRVISSNSDDEAMKIMQEYCDIE